MPASSRWKKPHKLAKFVEKTKDLTSSYMDEAEAPRCIATVFHDGRYMVTYHWNDYGSQKSRPIDDGRMATSKEAKKQADDTLKTCKRGESPNTVKRKAH